jgi:phytoene synthase
MPPAIRPAFATLWNLDLTCAEIVSTSTDPRLGAIRLAWWRDRLDELDTEGPIGGEPKLSAIARHVWPVTNGSTLSMVPESWVPLLNPFPWGDEVAEGLRQRGKFLFGIGAQIIGCDALDAEPAGAVWSLADGAFHCSDPQSRDFLLGEARAAIGSVPKHVPKSLRPLTVLAALAATDVLGKGRAARVAAAISHKLRGTLPRG